MQSRPRHWLPATFFLLVSAVASAQALAPVPVSVPSNAAQAPSARPERAIERLRIEDAGVRIDELRVGGETQVISVQPAGGAPAYEVRPIDAHRTADGAAGQGGGGARFWNIFKF